MLALGTMLRKEKKVQRASCDETKVIGEVRKGTDLSSLERLQYLQRLMREEARIILVPKSVGNTRSSKETRW